MENGKKYIVVSLVATISLFIDRVSKYLVSSRMTLYSSIELLRNFLYITYVKNSGIVFGLFHGNVPVFALVSLLGVGVIFIIAYYIHHNISKFSMLQLIAYGLIIGGALGNSYDRFVLGYVIDFVDVRSIFGFIFNYADACINVSVFLLLIDSYVKKGR